MISQARGGLGTSRGADSRTAEAEPPVGGAPFTHCRCNYEIVAEESRPGWKNPAPQLLGGVSLRRSGACTESAGEARVPHRVSATTARRCRDAGVPGKSLGAGGRTSGRKRPRSTASIPTCPMPMMTSARA
jgi:hypothetical protein